MATYVNDLRLKEIATGDESGTWGTSTNTNLELIANAMGVGAEAVANASTHTITMADGAADEFRSTFLRLTGGGQACTVTLAPNTLSHTWIMRNETAAALTLTQGSGANVIIAAGQTKIVATDGAGSGAIVYEMDDLELAGNLLVGGTLGVTGVLTATSLDISGDIDVDGVANLDVVDIDGAVGMATTLNVVGSITSQAGATITVADNSNNLTLTSTDGDANAGPKLDLYRNSTGPADADLLGRINFRGRNDNSQDVDYAAWVSRISDASDGSEDGILRADIIAAGAVVDVLTLSGTEVVVNESSADVDFRVESDGNANMLFVDGGNNNVNIGSTDQGGVRLGQVLNLTQTANFGGMSLSCYSTTNSHRHLLDFNKSGQATPGSHGVVANGEHLGSIFFRGDDGDEFIDGAQISAVVDGTPGNGDMPTMLTFSTTPDGAAASDERMRLDASGNVGIGTAGGGAALQVAKGIESAAPAAGAATGSACFGNDSSDDNYGLVLGADGFGKGYISAQRTDGTATTYPLIIQPNGNNTLFGTTTDAYIHSDGVRIRSNAVGSNVLDATLNLEGSGGDFYALNITGPTNVGFGILGAFSPSTDYLQFQYRASGSSTNLVRIEADGDFDVPGTVTKGSSTFRIDHPLPAKTETHHLVHSFIEGPQADNIYRGTVDLVDGSATVNIDTVSGMTEGTYVVLNTNTQCFTSNESGWTAVKGSVSGNTLTITAQENTCTDTISWMVVGERKDPHMIAAKWTDENGKVIVEPKKEDT